ncbi:MAG: sigma-54-dependent Fis family transcriptional regulator [Deltaproteobacteria bacterium]|nr:sigma-54-dependent Fis family transcriptional regulator [Deltaproteobacteria bacterium]
MSETRPTVLVVDDKPNMLSLIGKVLRKNARVLTASTGEEAVRLLEHERIDVVVCDLRMPGMDGLDVLRACRSMRPSTTFVLMTAHATVPTAIEAMKLGAYDYVTKPFEPEELRAVVLRALARGGLDTTGAERDPTERLPGVIARSAVMAELAQLVRRVAASDATALVLGETGTGKELVARALHDLSRRSERRFVAVSCAAIPSELLESELFGYARGAFTGAQRDRAGIFEEADHGTLFLDEIGELRSSLQAKLTRALEQRAVRRLGESRERPVDVRLVAATHRDLEQMVRADRFREDLWYRLRVAVIRLPPLRERREDIPLLAAHFLREAASVSAGTSVKGFTDAALDALGAHGWPGNVRELRAAVERATIVARSERIDVGDLPPEVLGVRTAATADLSAVSYQDALEAGKEEATRRYLESVLRRFRGRVPDAARHSGIERESFYRLLRKHGLRPDDYRGEPDG